MADSCRASFGDMAKDFDRLFEDVVGLTRREALSLDAVLKPKGVRTVLDCACGTGIQSIGLAQLGYQVSASDISPVMLRLLRDKASSLRLTIETKRSDFRSLRAWNGGHFDAVVSCGNSLSLVPSLDDVSRALASMLRVTKSPGGLGVIGVHNYPKLKREGEVLSFRRASNSDAGPEWVFDVRLFGRERVKVTHVFLHLVGRRWKLKTYTKSYLNLSPADLQATLLRVGYRSGRLLDIKGQRESSDGEWVLAVGEA